MILIVGLGNPGKQYSKTRHNVGFMAIDAFTDRFNLSPEVVKKFNSIIATGNFPNNFEGIKILEKLNEKLIFVKPQTYMNLSGEAVSKIANYYKIPLKNILVIHDEADLEIGKIKFKIGGGSAGHNGLKSLDQHLGKDYYRIRIGIGKHSHMELADYVLSEFNNAELTALTPINERIIDNFYYFIKNDLDLFQKNISGKYE